MPNKIALLLLVALATIGCDRISKHMAISHLVDAPPRSYLADTVRLEYTNNTGAFLGLAAGWPTPTRWLLFTFGTAGLTGLVGVAIRRRWSGLAAVGVTLLASGGLSNLFDRAMRGSVPDFLNVGVQQLRTDIFNVADVAIMIGAALVVLGSSARGSASRDGRQM